MRTYFERERGIILVGEVEAADINAWFAHMRKSPGGHGKPRSERTIQTYARSARAFFHWLVRRETIDADEFERLLLACAPPHETGPRETRRRGYRTRGQGAKKHEE